MPLAKRGVDEPAIGAEALVQPGLHLDDLAGEEARRVDEVAAVRQHVVLAQVSLGIAARASWPRARHDQRLDRIGRRVAMGAVAVPGLEREHLAHALVDEGFGGLQAGVEALHVADLEHLAGLRRRRPQPLDLGDVGADRLLAEHVLAGLERRDRGRDVQGVGGRHDHGLQRRIGQHGVVIGEGALGLVRPGHALEQVGRDVADGVQVGVASLRAALEMGCLRDGAAAENAHLERATVFLQLQALPIYFIC